MAYAVLFTNVAIKDLERIDQTVKRQLYKKLLYYKELDDMKVVARKLHNHDIGEYRLRVGNFRIIFDLDKHTIIILCMQHRKDVYK